MTFDENLTSAARLTIIASLIAGEPLTFMELKARSGLADGNLHVQTRKLEAAGYLEILRSIRGKRSVTRFRLTELGLESLKLHVRKLEAILAAEAGPIRPRRAGSREDDAQVWS